MRLIDIEAINWYDDLFLKGVNHSGVWVRYRDVEKLIRNAPIVDAEPVVRCKDCKWWVREGNDSFGYAMFCDHDCSLGGQGIKKPEDYCSYGERKGGDE